MFDFIIIISLALVRTDTVFQELCNRTFLFKFPPQFIGIKSTGLISESQGLYPHQTSNSSSRLHPTFGTEKSFGINGLFVSPLLQLRIFSITNTFGGRSQGRQLLTAYRLNLTCRLNFLAECYQSLPCILLHT